MLWWNAERRVRGLVLLGVFSVAGGLAFTGSLTAQPPLRATESRKGISRENSLIPAESQTQPARPIPGSGSGSDNQSHLTINGRDIPLPANGSVNKSVTSDNGMTSVNYSATHTSTSDGTANTNTSNVHVDIQSDSTTHHSSSGP